MLNWYRSSSQNGLQRRDVQPEDSHGKRKDDSREQVPVLRVRVEQGRMLEDTESASSSRHQIEPLHHNKVDKVDRRGLICLGEVVVWINTSRELSKAEPELAEGNTLTLEVPECHGEGGDCLEDAVDSVGLEDELPVHETIFLDVAWGTCKNVGFGLFVG